MKKIRIISAVLAILLAFSAMSLPVFAADPVDIAAYPTTEYAAMQAKLDTMVLKYEDKEAGYAMYFDTQSAEFALLNIKTGEYVFSNPYDVAVATESSGSKDNNDPLIHSLLSQVLIQYQDTLTGATNVLKSYTDAALSGGQIVFKDIKNGVRVEYAIGTVETKRLIPQWIEKSSFETQILDVLATHLSEMTSEERQVYTGIVNSTAFYELVGPVPAGAVYDPQAKPSPERPETYAFLVNNEEAQMYVLKGIGERAKKNIEALIRKYCPEYTYDKLEEDHELTGYEGDEKEPPLFRLAVEYTIDKSGLTASIPSKSIRYNETNYVLDTIALLPYFGCTTLKQTGAATSADGMITRTGGYIFIPDGSGTLLSYYNSDGTKKSGIQGGSMYGLDYAMQTLSATEVNAETFRVPVFGLTESYDVTKSVSRGNYRPMVGNKTEVESYQRGFFAVIEEGDSFATIRANLRQMGWAGASGTTEYSTVFAMFAVKQNDAVTIGSSIGGNQTPMTTTVDTKYTGNYTIHYTLLSDPELAKANNASYYDPSYVGMADAYRDYLIEKGAIEKLAASELESSLPLYIRSFGALDANDTFLSLPVTVSKPLTTFEDVITMSDDLKAENIVNVKFILEGFANGNMTKTYYPSYLKWSSTVGGKKGLQTLMAYAEENGIDIFPEFDFANVIYNKSSFSYRKYAAQSMSGRYSTKRAYDPVYQILYKIGYQNIVSTGSYMTLFSKFAKSYDKYGIGAISALSLGTDLNSDFNDEYPITREDSKLNTMELLSTMKEKYGNVLVQGGNSYALPYASDVVELPLDNSRYQISSYSIPFIGMVLHGYMNYAGDIINMDGDIKYSVLKSLENGAALYFLLSYQNTSELKNSVAENTLSSYSVSYQTWKNDLVRYYNMLNDAVKDLQNATITDHKFVTAYRLGADDANFMFTQNREIISQYETAKKSYYDTIAAVDQLRYDSKEAEATELLRTETSLRSLYNETLERRNLASEFSSKYATSGVVSVTYTADSGKKTTFFINYNSYDVAIEYNGGICILTAESFINSKDIQTIGEETLKFETVSALQPTDGQLKLYESAMDAYRSALENGTANEITRAKNALDRVLASIIKTTTNVSKLTDADGTCGYFNYTTSNALIPTADGGYEIVGPQAYVIK